MAPSAGGAGSPAMPPSWPASPIRSGIASPREADRPGPPAEVDGHEAEGLVAPILIGEARLDIRVSGHQIDTGEALRAQVDSRLHAHRRQIFLARHLRPGHLRQGPLRPQLHLRHRRPRAARAWCSRARPARPRRPPPSSLLPTGSKPSCAATSAGSRIAMAPDGPGRGRRSRPATPNLPGRPPTPRRPAVDNPPIIAETRSTSPKRQRVRRGDAARSAQHQRAHVPQQQAPARST